MSIPSEFLKGVFLQPHLFNNPENPEHGQWVHTELRRDFFSQAWTRVSGVEFENSEADSVMITSIAPCSAAEETGLSWVQQKYLARKVEPGDQLLRCEVWRVKGQYGVREYQNRFYQSLKDRFFSVTIPEGFFDIMTIELLNL